MKNKSKPKVIRLKDYTPPPFLVDSVHLDFDLHETATQVKATLALRRNPAHKAKKAPLELNGEDMDLKRVAINGKNLSPTDYKVDKDHLVIPTVPNQFTLETEVIINPKANTQLSGLYLSRGNFCTQCEAHGFRRITYFLDRPDVMTRFTTTIRANAARYPIMLSNGNLIEQKQLEDGRRWVKWEDPSLKSSYLFALVAGELEFLEDQYQTTSGRKVKLQLYVEKGKLNQASFAMTALKNAMRWDEETYHREYDLDIYMIVAVSDFNMGAMENKGLNIFNDRYILAKPETATDDDFFNVEGVIGHEYFHNWSGNRVTCRDWFQITLKEGLTIFRDQSFSGDLHSAVLQRIDDVNVIRTAQFSQDASPLAHSIRPESYIEINNFYTVTVYNKGAEVIRMIQTLIGKEKFRAALELYFTRYDGSAVTTEEFIKAMEDISGMDLKQFRRWYSQAGTPVITVKAEYQLRQKIYSIELSQTCPPTPGQARKLPFHIPFALGLLDSENGEDLLTPNTPVLSLTQKRQKFIFKNIQRPPIPSLLRNFSAPVKLNYQYSDDQLLFLMRHDSDDFNRWDAGQKLLIKTIFQLMKQKQRGRKLQLNPALLHGFKSLLDGSALDLQLLTAMLILPSMAALFEETKTIDVDALHASREFIKKQIAKSLESLFLQYYQQYSPSQSYQFTQTEIGKRSIKNLALGYLVHLDTADMRSLALKQFQSADNMTDAMGALAALNNSKYEERTRALNAFYEKWQGDDLVINKWFSLQAVSLLPNTLTVVKGLLNHPKFDYKNPNKVRALIGAFCANYVHFHKKNGSGYKFLADQVLKIDSQNSQLSGRLVEPLTRWRKFDKQRQQLMKAQLQRIFAKKNLSKDVYELVSKSIRK